MRRALFLFLLLLAFSAVAARADSIVYTIEFGSGFTLLGLGTFTQDTTDNSITNFDATVAGHEFTENDRLLADANGTHFRGADSVFGPDPNSTSPLPVFIETDLSISNAGPDYDGAFHLSNRDGSLDGTYHVDSPDPPTPAVPEPSSLALLGTGVLGLVGAAQRRFVTR